MTALFVLIIVLALLAAYLGYKLWRTRVVLMKRLRELDRLRSLANQKVEQLELETTKFELNPHFFRNSLSTLQNTINKSLMSVEKLSEVLEYALYDSQSNFVSLARELEFAQKFTEYNETRTSARFLVQFNSHIDPNDPFKDTNLIAPMITAYFIENAFKHSDLKSTDGFVRVQASLEDGLFTFEVQNKAREAGETKLKGGLGKESMRKRLITYYKDRFNVSYQYDENSRIHTATLTLNLNHEKIAMHSAGRG
ncbi:MAG: histidine kinase [Bacteroidetes bacterium]|nr:histidine kinase [Bacteroidota bacterium]